MNFMFGISRYSWVFFIGTFVSSVSAQMSIPASFRVSETGAAVYEIPIKVPPGVAGMEPNLSLVYNSQSGNGLLGVGWNLSGLSVIHRCPKTIAQDGSNRGVTYDAQDRYCLDGQRLFAVSGTHGADGTEYRTERESFTKIISYGTTGSGPSYFKAWSKSGQVIEYGNTTDSKIEAQGKVDVRVWALNRVQDTKSNYLTVTYQEDNANGDYRPLRMDYTGNSVTAAAPAASTQFVYATRTDTSAQFVGGSIIKVTKRLTNIKTYSGTNLIRDHQLAYSNSGSLVLSAINSITECDGAAACLPATTLTWQASTGNIGIGALANWASGSTVVAVGDINGDGLADLLTNDGNSLYWRVATGSGFGPALSLNQAGSKSALSKTQDCSDGCYWVIDAAPGGDFLADVNGDGLADLVMRNGVVRLSTGSGFAAAANWVSGSTVVAVGDINGDGLADILIDNGSSLYWRASTGAGFGAENSLNQAGSKSALSKTQDCSDGCYWVFDDAPGGDFLADVIGKGLAAPVFRNGSLRMPTTTTPDLLTAINTGAGAVVNISYTTLTNTGVYTVESGAAFPVRDVLAVAPLYVVSQISSSNGVGGNLSMSHAYAGAKAHLHGRGFLGFRQVQATDTQTGNKSLTTFRQDWPYVGLPSQGKRIAPDGTTILSQIDTTYACTNPANGAACTVAAGKRYFPYASQTDETSRDLNNTFISKVRTNSTYDTLGNATQISVTDLQAGGAATGYSKTTTNNYTNDTTNWLLGRLIRSQVHSTTP